MELDFLNFLDRSSVGAARTAGLQKDLHMSNQQYSIALTITYVPYICSELPIVWTLRKTGPNRILPLICVLWGIVTTFQGFVSSYGGLLAARFFLGLCEGGILPGIIVFMSMFYRRHQLQLRIALLFSAQSLAGAFSGLLAAAILNMDGLGGKRGWQWIFILEGIATVILGTFSYFVLPRTIATAFYLTKAEKECLLEGHRDDAAGEGHDVESPFNWTEVASVFTTPHFWFMFLMLFGNGVTLYGLAYFAPSIVNSLGYSVISTQLHSVPPYVCSAFFSICLAIFSDRFHARGLSAMIASVVALSGYAIYLGTANRRANYAALFLQTMGAYSTAPAISAWMPNNIRPYHKRSTAIALAFISTNCGGILSTWIFTSPPRYHKATVINLAMTLLIFTAAFANILWLSMRNKQKARQAVQGDDRQQHLLDDSAPDFKYTL